MSEREVTLPRQETPLAGGRDRWIRFRFLFGYNVGARMNVQGKLKNISPPFASIISSDPQKAPRTLRIAQKETKWQ